MNDKSLQFEIFVASTDAIVHDTLFMWAKMECDESWKEHLQLYHQAKHKLRQLVDRGRWKPGPYA